MVFKRYIVFSILGMAACIGATAQMNNVVEVENDYVPTVKDANKINILPEIEETRATHYNVEYTTTAIPTGNYIFQPMWAAQNRQLIRSDKKGFVTAGYGTNSNLIGRLAYGFDFTDNDKLNIDFSTKGHKGDLDHVNSSTDWNSRFFTNRFKADYEHYIDSLSSVIVSACYGTDVFNYQPPYWGTSTVTDKQRNSIFDAKVRLTPYSFGSFFIGGEASISTFRQNYVTNANDEYAETLINGTLTPGYKINDNMSVDVKLAVDNSSYGIDEMDGYAVFSASPHFYYHSGQFDLKAGLYVNTDGDIAPDVDATIHFSPYLDLYAQAEGGTTLNSFALFNQMTPYWVVYNYNRKIKHQFDQLRARGGIRTKPFDGLFVDLNAGYDISKRRAEIASFRMSDYQLLYAPVTFADGKRFYANVDLKYNYNDLIIAGVDATYNIWSSDYKYEAQGPSDYDKIESWRPVFDGKCKIEAHPLKGLLMGVDFLFQSFKKHDQLYDRSNTMDLGATIGYTFPFRLSVYAKGDNLLNKDYDQYIMYRTPGINFLFGAAYTF